LQTMFGIRAMWTEQVRDVYVLRRVEGQEAPPESRANKELMQMIRGEIHLENEPVSKLCKMLANSLRAVVLDETGLKGRYDFEIPYQPGQPAVTSDALKAMGLEALKAHRTVRMLVVRPDQPTKEQAHW
ncbi:MAG TPA: DUF3738 domain-containing protein, partial [Terriglobales bacterium]|nr:DUF3738 domain-containing protein [Terriglobales bacterium]